MFTSFHRFTVNPFSNGRPADWGEPIESVGLLNIPGVIQEFEEIQDVPALKTDANLGGDPSGAKRNNIQAINVLHPLGYSILQQVFSRGLLVPNRSHMVTHFCERSMKFQSKHSSLRCREAGVVCPKGQRPRHSDARIDLKYIP